MTKKLFEENVYLKTSEATVIKSENNVYVFDQTIFFPEGGGQSSDRGFIDGIAVIDVQEEKDIIYHTLERALEKDQVTMVLDWQKRFDEMQQHCGEHILSGVIKSKYNGNNKGFHIGNDFVTIDLDIKISDEMLEDIEMASNEVIYKNLNLKFETIEDTEMFPLRKLPTVTENIRVVTIPDVDCVACCGTHPHQTGEVGIIKLYKVEKNKGYSRISFKCGLRALIDLNKKTKLIQYFEHKYSADDETVVERYENDIEKYELLKKKYIALNKQVMDQLLMDQLDASKSYQVLSFDDLSSKDMNYIIKKASSTMDSILIVYSKSEKKVMMSHDGKKVVKCNDLYKDIKSFNGKGGGNTKTAQGIFDTIEAAEIFLAHIVSKVQEL